MCIVRTAYVRRLRAWCAGFMLVGALAGPAGAQEVMPLRGEVFIAGRTAIDPPPNEPRDSHAYLLIQGPAALRMYRSMRAKEEPNICEEGKRLKRAGPLMCSITRDGRSATCDFSVDLVRGALADGRPC